MRGLTARGWVVPQGDKVLTLRARGVLIEGSLRELYGELYMTRRAVQHVIDSIWGFERLPSLSRLHQMFYRMLREHGFRAHQAKQIYKYALSIVKSAKRNNGKKPELKKLTARLDRYDASVDLENHVVILRLRNKRFGIKLLHNKEYIGKFMGRKWYEVVLSIDSQGRVWVSIPFKWEYRPYNARGLISIDVNLRKLVIYNGQSIRRINTRFVEALSLKAHAEKLQRKYPRIWKYNKRMLDRIRSLHRRSRDIVVDWCRKIAKYIVLRAWRARSAIALEDLRWLWFNSSQKSPTLADKLSRFAYYKLQQAIIAKAIELSVPVIYVNPRGTSTTCPRCGEKLTHNHRLAMCRKCGLIADRDTIGAMNIHLRAKRIMWGSQGSPPNAPAMKNENRQSGRTRMRE